MRLDIIDAMTQMRRHFGNDGEILFHTSFDGTIFARFRVKRDGTWHSSEISINSDLKHEALEFRVYDAVMNLVRLINDQQGMGYVYKQ